MQHDYSRLLARALSCQNLEVRCHRAEKFDYLINYCGTLDQVFLALEPYGAALPVGWLLQCIDFSSTIELFGVKRCQIGPGVDIIRSRSVAAPDADWSLTCSGEHTSNPSPKCAHGISIWFGRLHKNSLKRVKKTQHRFGIPNHGSIPTGWYCMCLFALKQPFERGEVTDRLVNITGKPGKRGNEFGGGHF